MPASIAALPILHRPIDNPLIQGSRFFESWITFSIYESLIRQAVCPSQYFTAVHNRLWRADVQRLPNRLTAAEPIQLSHCASCSAASPISSNNCGIHCPCFEPAEFLYLMPCFTMIGSFHTCHWYKVFRCLRSSKWPIRLLLRTIAYIALAGLRKPVQCTEIPLTWHPHNDDLTADTDVRTLFNLRFTVTDQMISFQGINGKEDRSWIFFNGSTNGTRIVSIPGGLTVHTPETPLIGLLG